MNAQILTTPMLICNFVLAVPEADLPAEKPVHACSRDYGFDFDDTELAEELTAPLPADLTAQPIPDVEAKDFEQIFHYFYS